jgi:AcrR family transcriptional regulator
MGPKGSPIWSSMLDAAEEILCDEGYGALTSRRVAERIGVKQRLVYYYFRTMDELIVETFRRLSAREKERMSKALSNDRPLREIWDVCVKTTDTRLVSEFMALANRVEALQVEVRGYIEESRRMQVFALAKAMTGREQPADAMPPIAAAIFATSAALAMHREAELGIRTGHAEVMAIIEDFIARWD